MSPHLEGREPMPASGQACSYAVVELKGDAREERDVIKHQGLLCRLETEAASWSQECSLAWDSLHTGLGKCRSQGRGEAGIGVLRAEMHTALHAICNAPSPSSIRMGSAHAHCSMVPVRGERQADTYPAAIRPIADDQLVQLTIASGRLTLHNNGGQQ